MAIRTALSGLICSLACTAALGALPAMQNDCFDTSDGVRLCYTARLLPDTPAPLLVFVPGWTMPAAIWQRQLDHFANRRSVLAFDPRGQGESAAPDQGYTLDRRILDIKELLDRFPERRIVLVGWSLAVYETLAYATTHGSNRLSGLVLVDNSIGAGTDPSPPSSGENPFFTELRTAREETLRRFAVAIFRDPPDENMHETIVASALKTAVEDSIRLLSYGRPRTEWRDIAFAFPHPLLYLTTPRWRGQAEELVRENPRAAAHVFDNAGHALFWDEAERFNRLIETFLAELP